MKTLLAALSLTLLATAAVAQPRPATPDLTCGQARALVATRGAVVLGTGARTYERFVSHSGYCAREEIAEQTFAPTRDAAQCPVGFRCILRELESNQG